MNDSQYSLKAFMLAVVLWLPLAFFVWFYLAAVLVMPVQLLVGPVLHFVLGDGFDGIVRSSYLLEVGVLVNLPEGRAVADVPVNPMIYGYGLPLIAGLSIATPLATSRRALQLVAAFAAVVAIQVWSVFWETFRTLAFELGEPGRAVTAEIGLRGEVIALAYQFGYLVFPAVIPVALWVLMNRAFIEGLVQHRMEPTASRRGQ